MSNDAHSMKLKTSQLFECTNALSHHHLAPHIWTEVVQFDAYFQRLWIVTKVPFKKTTLFFASMTGQGSQPRTQPFNTVRVPCPNKTKLEVSFFWNKRPLTELKLREWKNTKSGFTFFEHGISRVHMGLQWATRNPHFHLRSAWQHHRHRPADQPRTMISGGSGR